MNANITKINDDIVAVNFGFMDAGFITELGIIEKQPSFHEGDVDALRITYDGRFILNKEVGSEVYVKFIQAVMTLKDSELNTTKGFYKAIRHLFPKVFAGKPDVMIMTTLKNEGCYVQNVTLFEVLSEWEQERRKVKKDWMKRKRSS